MKWIFTIILLISAAGSCEPLQAKPSDWSEEEQKLWKSYVALSVLDTYQTMHMIDCQKRPHCPLIERNPILGERPSKGQLITLKLFGNVLIYHILDNEVRDREKALRWLNGVQGFVVVHNGVYWYRKF